MFFAQRLSIPPAWKYRPAGVATVVAVTIAARRKIGAKGIAKITQSDDQATVSDPGFLRPAMSKGFCCIGLFNPKSPENVGSVLRAAGCYGVNTVFYTGVRYDRAKEFVTDTKKVYRRIPLIGIADLQHVIPLDCTPVAIELIEGAKPLPEYSHPERAFYIFGPEDGTLDKTVRAWCADVVYIPTVGCMNLAATVNVVLYDRMAKAHRKSRPTE